MSFTVSQLTTRCLATSYIVENLDKSRTYLFRVSKFTQISVWSISNKAAVKLILNRLYVHIIEIRDCDNSS